MEPSTTALLVHGQLAWAGPRITDPDRVTDAVLELVDELTGIRTAL